MADYQRIWSAIEECGLEIKADILPLTIVTLGLQDEVYGEVLEVKDLLQAKKEDRLDAWLMDVVKRRLEAFSEGRAPERLGAWVEKGGNWERHED